MGVLSKEVPLSWPEETLKAQIIASKAYVLSMMDERKNSPFDVEGSILDQHFDSDILFATTPRARKIKSLIEEVKNITLLNKEQKNFRAYFHADCGGETVSAQKVWGAEPTAEVKDPYCVQNPASSWFYVIEKFQPTTEIKTKALASRGNLIPRISDVEWQGAWMGVNRFRQMLGFEKIKSSRFRLEQKGDELWIQGRGLGHGVGLCQRGSFVMGEKGFRFEQILGFYYPEAILESKRAQ